MEEVSPQTVTANGSVECRPKSKGRGSSAYQSVGGDGDAPWKDECGQRGHGGVLVVAATTTRKETANGTDKTSQAQAHTEGTSGVGFLEPTRRGDGNESKHDVATATFDSSRGDDTYGGSGSGGDGLTALASPQGPPADQENIGVCGPGGLLATPNLKTILPIVCAVQVRGGVGWGGQ